ncbi:type IV secretion system protein [Legionella lytica]|uniref:Type IV secretion system protein n=1 Tax=Legionella lytica TaxID=96232 RepID=A0ABW8DBL0_9GAMM
MNPILTKTTCSFALLFSLISVSHADLLGVEDAALLANAIKQLDELRRQYNVLQDTYDTAKSQADTLKSLKEYNSGSYGYGAFDNGLDALKSWQNPTDNWKEALEKISGGNPERYAELVKSYEASHPMLNDVDYAKGTTSNQLTQYKYSKKVNKAVSVETTKTFNEINTRLKNINKLALKIDETPNTKSAMDLNSRITAELAYINVMNLKLQTLLTQQLAQNSANDLAEEGELVRFNTSSH